MLILDVPSEDCFFFSTHMLLKKKTGLHSPSNYIKYGDMPCNQISSNHESLRRTFWIHSCSWNRNSWSLWDRGYSFQTKPCHILSSGYWKICKCSCLKS